MVKYTKPDNVYIQRQLLYMRYKTEKPDKINKPRAVISISFAARLLSENPDTLYWLERKYFQ